MTDLWVFLKALQDIVAHALQFFGGMTIRVLGVTELDIMGQIHHSTNRCAGKRPHPCVATYD